MNNLKESFEQQALTRQERETANNLRFGLYIMLFLAILGFVIEKAI